MYKSEYTPAEAQEQFKLIDESAISLQQPRGLSRNLTELL